MVWWFFWGAVYYFGGLQTLRALTLHFHGRVKPWVTPGRNYSADALFAMAWGTILWPIVAFCYFSWKLIFPRGVKTRLDREMERAAIREDRRKELERSYNQATAILKEWDQRHQDPTQFIPGPQLRRVLAEQQFTDACDQVWRDRGKPWGIGRLANVRIRRSKTAA